MSVLLSVLTFLVFIGLVAFLWFWWAAPRDQVPPHLGEAELRRLEVQDRLRQTTYQLLAAAGLAGTFVATMIQFGINTRQWAADFELKTSQERLTQYTEAIKTIGIESSPTTQIASITTLQLLGSEDPTRFHHQASEVLTQFIADHQVNNRMRRSLQCEINPDTLLPYDRDEAPASLKIAMMAVGHPQFAAHRLNYSTDKCDPARQSIDRSALWLEHLALDNLNLSGRDFSCAKMAGSQFHRTVFAGADLRGADLRGTQLADFQTPGFPVETIGHTLYLKEADGGPLEWQRYRCWTTDFRGAKMQDANFEGAVLAGADFRWADLKGVNFCRADLSRANFTDANGLTKEMLEDACVGKSIDRTNPDQGGPVAEDAQPFGIEKFGKTFRIPRCFSDKICPH